MNYTVHNGRERTHPQKLNPHNGKDLPAVERIFMRVTNICEFIKNGPLNNVF